MGTNRRNFLAGVSAATALSASRVAFGQKKYDTGATDTEIWPADFANADRSRMVRAADVAAAIRLMIEAPAATSFDRIAVTPGSGSV